MTTKPKTMQELFAAKDSWCRTNYAVDTLGQAVDAEDHDAVRWCLVGAMNKVYPNMYHPTIRQKLSNAIKNIHDFKDLVYFNDDPYRTIGDIRALVKRAGV